MKKLTASGSLKGVRVGVPREYFLPGLDAEVEGCVQKGITKLKPRVRRSSKCHSQRRTRFGRLLRHHAGRSLDKFVAF